MLDIFLLRQFIETREPDLSFIPETSIEEGLKTDIEGLDLLTDEAMQGSYLYGSRKELNDEEKEELEQFENQEIEVLPGDLIVSKLTEPVSYDEDNLQSFLESNVLNGENYVFWGKNDETNTLIYFQKIKGNPIYYNQSGLLLILLNDQDEMVQYTQTILKNEDDQQEDYDLFTDTEAIMHLYNNTNELNQGDELTDIKIGYHNLTPLPNGGQVLAPTWKITINENRNYFIHAIEGNSFPRDDKSFLEDTIIEIRGLIQDSNNGSDVTKEIQENFSEMIESTNWSGD